ncbi:T9SS type A sorting domain-containing protein [Candidatus Poribacteria bacterium]|nr:T9SS type A sorting domain-containing protein [Candidatus Poribacteria bacterium]
MFNSSSSPKVTNCTFSGNLAGYGGGMYNTNISNPTVTNCILWEDSGKEIYNLDSTPTVTYCDVQGGYEGTGNIDADPKFTNPDAGDFTLQYNSPCIDAGKNPYAYDETINHDLGWKEDMGAYEYSGVRVSKSVSGIGEILFGGQVRAKVNVTILGTLSAIGITVHPGETHPDAPASVRRWFSVTATGEESVFDLTLSYKDSELNGETEENLNLWRWTGEAWEGPKTPARNPGDNYLLIDSQTAFSDWVIAEALEQRLPGDVSGNGSITAYDASLVLQYIVGLRELSDEDIDAADVTGNGTVTALDAALILQYTVGLITQFPVESKTGAPTLEATSEESALSKTIAQLEATPLNEEQKQVLEQLKRLVSQKLIPARTALFQNYPNPFNPETWLPYQLATDAPVTIRIYNTKGQLIRIINLSNQKAGIYLTKDRAAYWDGNNAKGEAVSSGVYFYQLQAGDFFATRKMVIVK